MLSPQTTLAATAHALGPLCRFQDQKLAVAREIEALGVKALVHIGDVADANRAIDDFLARNPTSMFLSIPSRM